MSKWLGLLYGLVKITLWLIDQFEEYKVIQAEEARALREKMEAADVEVQQAIKVRKAVTDDLNAHPDKLHDDDGFRRD